jgi:hypothetical protein
MRVLALVAVLCAVAAAGCRDNVAEPDHQAEWHDVLERKKAAVAPNAEPHHKQVYADSVRAFVQKHPNHGRAREVWHRMQIEFADDLAAVGRYQDAIRFYRGVLVHDPNDQNARRGLAAAMDRLIVTREKLLMLHKGMREREVAAVLGKPIPGWTITRERSGARIEAWYYRMRGGALAAVYFRNGVVFAAEETSHERLGRLGS